MNNLHPERDQEAPEPPAEASGEDARAAQLSDWCLPLVALQFLTRLPVRLAAMPTPEQFGRAALYYPLVGVLIGVGAVRHGASCSTVRTCCCRRHSCC